MSRAEPRQLVFDLPVRPALGAEDFMVSSANEAALAFIERWPDWPHFAAVLEGPGRSGKSHLANVWRFRSGAAVTAAQDMPEDLAHRFLDARALLVENLEAGVGDEQMLFHLLNLAREHKLSMLLTSRVAPGDLPLVFPDLVSRLKAAPVIRIAPPDDHLLEAVLIKHFADRQLTVEPQVVTFIVRHMERSFAAAQDIVMAIDQRSLATRRRVTRALANAVILARGGDGTGDPGPEPTAREA